MGERRKLQGEIERVLKRVGDGVEVFEDIWEKVQNSSNQNQKEKHEQELKKEIKKLQRLRDQIKNWLTSNDIKDKTALTDARRKIENLMERFKVVERETKTKAYSKEGLGALQKLDPQRKEKDDAIQWLSQAIESLQLQTDTAEAETEAIVATSKKKKDEKERQARLDALRKRIDRYKYHIGNLEKILRLVDNDAINMKHVNDLKDDVDHYIESNQYADFQENDEMYSEINFDEIPMVVSHSLGTEDQSRRRTSECDDLARQSAFPGSSTGRSGAVGRQKSRLGSHSSSSYGASMARNSSGENRHLSESNCVFDSKSSYGLTGPNSAPSSSDFSMIGTLEYKAKSSSNLASPPFAYATPSLKKEDNTGLDATVSDTKSQCPTLRSDPLALEGSEPQPMKHHQPLVFSSEQNLSEASTPTSTSKWPSSVFGSDAETPSSQPPPAWENFSWQQKQPEEVSPTAADKRKTFVRSSSACNTTVSREHRRPTPIAFENIAPSQITVNEENTDNRQAEIPCKPEQGDEWVAKEDKRDFATASSAKDSLRSQSYTQLAACLAEDPWPSETFAVSNSLLSTETRQAAETSHVTAPVPWKDCIVTKEQPVRAADLPSRKDEHEPSRASSPYVADACARLWQRRTALASSAYRRMGYADSDVRDPPSDKNDNQTDNRIKKGLLSGTSDFSDFFSKLSTESLFFIFYYMEGTFAQYSAAKALKKRSWRFHTKYLMWFQRHEQPKAIRDDCEQGTYIYFDFEKWVQKKKEGFTFEYRYLEDRDFI